MSNINITYFILLLSFTFLLQTSIRVSAVQPLYHFCSSTTGNFTSNTIYEKNLNTLLGNLERDISPLGFSHAVSRIRPSWFFGISLCRGDVKSPKCNACVRHASIELRKICPYNKGAIIWYDDCLLKYLDQSFFGKIDTKNKFYLLNVANVSHDPNLFNQNVKGLLSKLALESANTKERFSFGSMKLDTFTNLYGSTQCTQDLSNKACKICLDEAIRELPNCCYGKRGGRIIGGSCNMRYELYPFVNS
ncbi:cysteine-rich repeat secretory protein 38-like [Spinacia oleracea]|uniref:Cysteine-rich repeat secretory protein 38-like n=1 Tax=Spinacia oleracea TaxID=3562 RepID=A0A9R0IEX1_SPIOL|nr:cysteine-rich repeat secretory protein 38-like [Spinacia oleracea]